MKIRPISSGTSMRSAAGREARSSRRKASLRSPAARGVHHPRHVRRDDAFHLILPFALGRRLGAVHARQVYRSTSAVSHRTRGINAMGLLVALLVGLRGFLGLLCAATANTRRKSGIPRFSLNPGAHGWAAIDEGQTSGRLI